MVSLLGYLRVHFAMIDGVEEFQHPDILAFGHYRFLLITTFFIALFFAFCSTLVDVFVIRPLLHKKSLGFVLLIGFVVQSVLIFFLVNSALRFVNHLIAEITNNTGKVMGLNEVGSLVIVLILAGALSRMFIEIEHKLGPGNFVKLLSGSYYNPKEVERIFMFVDLKDSTKLAEQMGHLKFSAFIKDCFHDFAVVDNYGAEIYQYVGDEAIISWNKEKGLKNSRFIQAFFAFTDVLKKKEAYYLQKYGVQPFFKAGVHLGYSVMTEVGEIKKEFCFHGDTLNTTARIQAQCNNLSAQILMSEALQSVALKPKEYRFHDVGAMELKGKEQAQKLYKIERI